MYLVLTLKDVHLGGLCTLHLLSRMYIWWSFYVFVFTLKDVYFVEFMHLAFTFKDVHLVEFMYLAFTLQAAHWVEFVYLLKFTHIQGESHCRQFRSLLLCSCNVF